MSEPSWKDINGKTIKYTLDFGVVIEAIVIADPEVGISIKPLDAKEVPEELPEGDSWSILPSDPDFFLICVDAVKDRGGESFAHWVAVLSEDGKVFKETDLVPGYISAGSCPFS